MSPRELLSRSPQQIDPLSWFTGPVIPVVLGSIALVYGLIVSIASWSVATLPGLQLAATALMVVPFMIVHLGSRPRRSAPSARSLAWAGASAVAIAWIGLAVSTAGYAGGGMPVEQWWAAVVLGVVIGALAPYCTPRLVGALGLLSAGVAGALAVPGFAAHEQAFPTLTTVLVAASPALVGTVAAVIFSVSVVSRLSRWFDDPRNSEQVEVGDPDISSPAVEELRALHERVGPLLLRVADTGVVTARDRAVARILSQRIRDVLVLRTSRSWLEALADELPIAVIDPERRADSMRPGQRAALRGLLAAAANVPELEGRSVVVEMRGEPNGSTAVALRLQLGLPEGRRLVMLAPYYVTLGTTVDNLRWDGGRELNLRFHLAPDGR